MSKEIYFNFFMSYDEQVFENALDDYLKTKIDEVRPIVINTCEDCQKVIKTLKIKNGYTIKKSYFEDYIFNVKLEVKKI